MQKQLSFAALLSGAAAFLAACSGSGELSDVTQPPEQNQIWMASVVAQNADIVVTGDTLESDKATRAMFIGGNDGTRFAKCWDDGDNVYAYKAGAADHCGVMSPARVDWGFVSATLNGTFTGPFSVGEELTLYLPARVMDFTGQTGLIQSLSAKAYRQATTTVTEAADQILSLTNVRMDSRTTFGRFYLTDEQTGERLHPSRLVIHAISGPSPVLRTDEDGTPTERGDLVINGQLVEGEYPGEIYVSMYKESEAFNYTLTATVGEDIYVGPVEGQNAIASQDDIGGLANYRRKMRKTTSASTLTIADIPDQTFTGYSITPVLTVKDGEDELTMGTDYSVAYTSNVNVGDATATITGLADALAQAQTKYLGTQDKTFSIVQATPVIVMDATTMELVNNATQNTATRTVTRVFIDNNGNGTWDEGTDYDITGLCTVTYSTDNDAVATVNETSGLVTAAGFGTTTITTTVVAAQNWTSQTATYTVNVEQEVNGQNTVNPWTSGGEPEGGKIYVE